MKDATLLKAVQDKVWADPSLKADTWPDGSPRTHCNQAALAVANGMGCHDFDAPVGGEPYTADQLFYFFQRTNGNGGPHFLEKNMEDVQDLANAGSLVFAIVPSWTLLEKHGHIVSITPGITVHSPLLGKDVPVCLNVSTAPLSARMVGLNFAFPMHSMAQRGATVRFFAWRESL